MNLSTFIEALNQLIKDNPEAADYTVITAKDAEGNGFDEIYFSPSLGHFDDGEFYGVESIEDLANEAVSDGYEPEVYVINSVCVN